MEIVNINEYPKKGMFGEAHFFSIKSDLVAWCIKTVSVYNGIPKNANRTNKSGVNE